MLFEVLLFKIIKKSGTKCIMFLQIFYKDICNLQQNLHIYKLYIYSVLIIVGFMEYDVTIKLYFSIIINFRKKFSLNLTFLNKQ